MNRRQAKKEWAKELEEALRRIEVLGSRVWHLEQKMTLQHPPLAYIPSRPWLQPIYPYQEYFRPIMTRGTYNA